MSRTLENICICENCSIFSAVLSILKYKGETNNKFITSDMYLMYLKERRIIVYGCGHSVMARESVINARG